VYTEKHAGIIPARYEAVTYRRRKDMDRFEDKRINEALELLNAVARDRKADLEAAVKGKYTDFTSLVGALSNEAKSRATEKYEAGKQKVVDVAKDVDQSVHHNPWAFIGGAALTGLLLGLLLGRSRRD
jgi:ElaB/YqjD/DUF883 family membrane-anchored ribosome-binding protein